MRKTKAVIAKLLLVAVFISLFAGVQGITTEAAVAAKLSLMVGQTKKVTIKNAKNYKISWKIKNKKIATFKKSGKYAVKVKAKKAGKTTLTATVKKGRKKKRLFCKITVNKIKTKVIKTLLNTPKPTVVLTPKPTVTPKPTAVITPKPTAVQTLEPTSAPTFEPQDTSVPAMKKIFKDVIDNVGTCINYNEMEENGWQKLQNMDTMKVVDYHFNSFTLENEMNPDNMLNKNTMIFVADAKADGYVISDDYKESVVPALALETIDEVLATAKQHNLRMRAHTLIWYQQTPTWFFKEDYSDDGNIVDASTMNARLEFYVRTIMRYTMQKEKELTGEAGSLVYAWDVLNEYVHRTNQPTTPTWTDVYGEMGLKPTYIKAAFEYAYDELKKENVQDKVTLFCNDYDTYFNVNNELALISYINQGEEAKICGGIGMQSHLDIKRPTLEEYGNALKAFMNAGLEVQITELDITINFDTDGVAGDYGDSPSYDYKDERETDSDQAAFTKDFIKQIVVIQKNRDKTISPKGITGITVGGLSDQVSLRSRCRPLFFTRRSIRVKDVVTGGYQTRYYYAPKQSYEAMIEALK